MTATSRRATRRLAAPSLPLLVALATALAGARTSIAQVPRRPPRPHPIPNLPAERPNLSAGWADSVVATLSLRDKAAQMVWPFILGDYVPRNSAQWRRTEAYVTQQRVGGFIVSVGSPTEIAVKLNALQRASALPLLVGADLETGAGFRVRGGYFLPNAIDLGGATVFPPQMALGATRDTGLAYAQGRVTAREGRALGIHIAFAPVLDVNNNPDNPVINTRSFGEDPRLVALLGAALVRGIQDNGMIATGKHFPGHGDTGTNSHLALPVVTVSRARLDSVELLPFRAAVNAGVGAIMSFHGVMPALDPTGVPGTLSPRVLSTLLRDQMRFEGLVFSDAMDMEGVLKQYGAVEATKRAVAAGVDVLIQPLDVRQTIDAVVAGVSEGRYTEARLDRSVRRILAAKQRMGLDQQRVVDIDSVRGAVADSANLAAARTVAERSITLVRDVGGTVRNGRLRRAGRVLSITVARRADLGAGVAFTAELRGQLRRAGAVRAEYVNADDPAPDVTRLVRAADSAEETIVSSYVAQTTAAANASAPRPLVELIRALVARRGNLVVVAFGNPYLLREVPEAPAYVVAWGGAGASQQAAARALLGTIPFAGRSPISIVPAAGTR